MKNTYKTETMQKIKITITKQLQNIESYADKNRKNTNETIQKL